MKKPANCTLLAGFVLCDGGRSGIRTLEGGKALPVFKTGAIDHSANLPLARIVTGLYGLLAHHQHRHMHGAQHTLGHAAEHQLF